MGWWGGGGGVGGAGGGWGWGGVWGSEGGWGSGRVWGLSAVAAAVGVRVRWTSTGAALKVGTFTSTSCLVEFFPLTIGGESLPVIW